MKKGKLVIPDQPMDDSVVREYIMGLLQICGAAGKQQEVFTLLNRLNISYSYIEDHSAD